MCTGNKNNFCKSACVFEFSDVPKKCYMRWIYFFFKKEIVSSICKLIQFRAITYQPGFMCVICISLAM